MRCLSTIALAFGVMGCAASAHNASAGARPETGAARDRALEDLRGRCEAQAQRVAELENRVALLESEARRRRQGPVKPTDTVRIGEDRHQEREGQSDRDEVAETRPSADVPVIRLHEDARQVVHTSTSEPDAPPPAPPGVETSLPVVPLPRQRMAAALERAEQVSRQHVRDRYRRALRLLRARQYDDAVSAFDEFLERYPQHSLSGDALYWLGEAHYARRQYKAALGRFQIVVERYPDSKKRPDSLLKLGMCHERLGNPTKAQRYFERVRTQFPNSSAATAVPAEGSS